MATHLLNDNQSRHFSTYLRLLADDLDYLAQMTELNRSGTEYDSVRAALVDVRTAVWDTRKRLSVLADKGPDFKRRVAVVVGVWSGRVEELRPRNLKGLGEVRSEAAQYLDPLIDRVRRQLEALAAAAERLAEE
jgi:hypothetical protein